MKVEFIDLSATQKNLIIEISSETVDDKIFRLTKKYSRTARISGFRPGKVPPKLVQQRFHEQIFRDVAQDLIPQAVNKALQEKGIEPVDTPKINDVELEEGRPLKFKAFFETVPPIDPGDYQSLILQRKSVHVEPIETDRALEKIRELSAQYETVEGRPTEHDDTVIANLERRALNKPATTSIIGAETSSNTPPDRQENISIQLGGSANPPGFDEEIVGLSIGMTKNFTIVYPQEYTVKELIGAEVHYSIEIKEIKRRILPELNDKFAKDLGNFKTLDMLRDRISQDLLHQAEHKADQEVRTHLLKKLAERVTFEAPEALLVREINRRITEFARQLAEQGIDPKKANVDWQDLREKQKSPASETIRGALVLDEIARREKLIVTDEEIQQEIKRIAERSNSTESAVHDQLEKEGGSTLLRTGFRREKAIDFLLSHARIENA